MTATLFGAALLAASCQDGYPIAATRCDRWCDLTQATWCGRYNPASCVVGCEQLAGGADCYPQFDRLLICLEQQPTIRCDPAGGDGVVLACSEAQGARELCTMAHTAHGPPTGN